MKNTYILKRKISCSLARIRSEALQYFQVLPPAVSKLNEFFHSFISMLSINTAGNESLNVNAVANQGELLANNHHTEDYPKYTGLIT